MVGLWTGTALGLAALGAPVAPAQEGGPGCLQAPLQSGLVEAVRPPMTLELEGGRHLVLSLLDVPHAAGEEPFANRAADVLARVAEGRRVSFLALAEPDRHGRVPALVFVEAPAGMAWLQQVMVERGLARVASFPDQRACAKELLAFEAAARTQGGGVWSDPRFAPRDAASTSELMRRTGTFQIVEGTVADVATVRGTTYLNFGGDYRSDFTVVVARRDARLFGDGEPDLKTRFEGRRVRVRGWIEEQNGPAMRMTHPEQVELVDAR